MSGAQTRAGSSGPRTVRLSRLVAVLLAIVMVTLAMVGDRLSEVTSDYELVPAPLDAAVPYDEGEVEVSDVRVGSMIMQRDDSYSSKGLFVVVHVAVRATGADKVTVSSSRLLAEGAAYEPAFIAGDSITADPGFMTERDLVFEVDPARTTDLTLELWSSGLVFRYYQRTRTALGITAGNAAAWAEAGRDVTLVVPRNPTSTALP